MISICIPVYNSEKYLTKCLDSLAAQTYKDFEIIVIDDCSEGKNEKNWNCKKICKVFSKETKIKINYICNTKNLGSLETRRIAFFESKGDYIFYLDSDDTLQPDCLEKLYSTALTTNSQIIQCGANPIFTQEETEKDKENLTNKINRLFEGTLTKESFFNECIQNHKANFFVWGKLFKKELLEKVWNTLPYSYCVWAEDYAIFFFVAYFASSYTGIKDKLYNYSANTGISSESKIETLEQWEKKCTAASSLSIIFDFISSNSECFTLEQKEAVQRQSNTYVLEAVKNLNSQVIPELKQQAFEMLCDYWGPDYVKNIIRQINQENNIK